VISRVSWFHSILPGYTPTLVSTFSWLPAIFCRLASINSVHPSTIRTAEQQHGPKLKAHITLMRITV
jgi:hypothetical protein